MPLKFSKKVYSRSCNYKSLNSYVNVPKKYIKINFKHKINILKKRTQEEMRIWIARTIYELKLVVIIWINKDLANITTDLKNYHLKLFLLLSSSNLVIISNIVVIKNLKTKMLKPIYSKTKSLI